MIYNMEHYVSLRDLDLEIGDLVWYSDKFYIVFQTQYNFNLPTLALYGLSDDKIHFYSGVYRGEIIIKLRDCIL